MRAWGRADRIGVVVAAALFVAPMLLALLGAALPAQAQTRGSLSVELRTTESADAPVASTVQLYQRSYALVIGIDDYQSWPRLSYAVADAEAVAAMCRDWNTELVCRENRVWLEVNGYFPEREIRTAETSGAVSQVATVPFVRGWMKEKQRSCVQFGNLVMEGRDIGSNIFPETPHKFFMDAGAAVRQARRDADGVQENLAARDERDSTRKAAPLMVAEGATVINNAGETPEQTSARIIALVKERLGD